MRGVGTSKPYHPLSASPRVRGLLRGLALVAAFGLTLGPVIPAAAMPAPASDEWWFSTLNVQQQVWPVTEGRGVTVAVLDSGVNASLPEVGSVLLPGGDTSGRGSDGHTDFDPSGGHGTGVAVLIAGQGGDAIGLVGVAPQAKVLPVTVEDGLTTPEKLAGTLAAGIRYAVDNGAQVINMSLAEPASAGDPDQCPQPVLDAVAYAVKHNVVLVAGAGNGGAKGNPVEFPGSCPGVLAVGAVDRQSNPWSESETQNYVSVAAPGVDMPFAGSNPPVYYPHSSGTSNASALVAGEAALVRAANPSLSAREVVGRIIGTAGSGGSSGQNDQTGYGVINIARAVNSSVSVPAGSPNPPFSRLDQWQGAQNPSAAPSSRPSPAASTAPTAASKNGSSGSGQFLGGITFVVLAIVAFALLRARANGTGPWTGRQSPK